MVQFDQVLGDVLDWIDSYNEYTSGRFPQKNDAQRVTFSSDQRILGSGDFIEQV